MKLLNKYDLAGHFGVSHHTITLWRRRHLLPFVKTGYRSIRYNLEECEQALRKFRIVESGT